MPSADTPTIPLRLACRMVLACANELAHSLRERLHRNPRRSHKPAVHAGRRDRLAQVEAEIARLRRLVVVPSSVELPADTAALLAAWQLGHTDARKQLADLLAEDGRADVLRPDSTPAQVMADLCR